MERIRDFHDYAPYKFTFTLLTYNSLLVQNQPPLKRFAVNAGP